jgi:hypothetical protein
VNAEFFANPTESVGPILLIIPLLHLMVQPIKPAPPSHTHSIFCKVFPGLGILFVSTVESVLVLFVSHSIQMVYPILSAILHFILH